MHARCGFLLVAQVHQSCDAMYKKADPIGSVFLGYILLVAILRELYNKSHKLYLIFSILFFYRERSITAPIMPSTMGYTMHRYLAVGKP